MKCEKCGSDNLRVSENYNFGLTAYICNDCGGKGVYQVESSPEKFFTPQENQNGRIFDLLENMCEAWKSEQEAIEKQRNEKRIDFRDYTCGECAWPKYWPSAQDGYCRRCTFGDIAEGPNLGEVFKNDKACPAFILLEKENDK